ncbi:kexin [Elsinoe australis]|uniref:Kexin n=1 Tax=Elsinoe australis TaxID=40998 RepID=A0A4V6DV81_9PEZI|nr:kexin [Elsinoe australis]
MQLSLLALLAASFSTGLSSLIGADWDRSDYYAVEVSPGKSVEDVARRLGLKVHSALGELENHYLLEAPKCDQDVIVDAVTDLKLKRRKRSLGWDEEDALDHVQFNQKQVRRKKLHKRGVPRDYPRNAQSSPPTSSNVQKGLDIAKSLGIADPIFKDQWHLYNTHETGNDINVTGVWQSGITGKGSISCIIDDGLDFDSDDLSPNYFAEGSWDYNNPGPDPKPRLDDDRHGTRCAGEIAAAKNDVCGVGVAYDSKVSGVRILSAVISDADEALALNYNMENNHIYSCSWGPPDDGRSMEAPGILIRKAMLNGIQKGRKGLGSLFVFAIGNGASNDDDCNFDGYTNSIYSVSVGGIDRKGLHPYYSEKCSAQLVVTYSSGSGDAIHTTEVGKNDCYVRHGGTSAAGPLVAGIYALVLEARPDLHWRDFQWITMMTAIPLDEAGGQWQDTPFGKKFSHQYGYGKIDAYRVVELAKNWTSVKPQAWFYSPWLHVRHEIPQGEEGLASHFDVTKEMLQKANLERIEHVTVTMNVQHTRRGDLSVELRSPEGIVSHIATPRRNDDAMKGYVDWTFMSVAHWGESGIGTWTVVVKDTNQNDHKGTFTDWRLRLWGESIDGEKQELLPMPTEDDDKDHDSEETTTAIVGTITHGDTHPTGEPEGNPSDHPDRPVNAKPTDTTSTASAPTSTTTPIEGVPVPDPDSEKNPNLLPTPFPTFGVSKKTQVWIYGAFALIAIFCVSLAIWYILTKRRNRRNARDEYEFEMLDEDDADDDGARSGLMNGGFGNGDARKKRQAGELYDAFAEGSEDDDNFSIGEEDEERYRDEDEDHGEESEKVER